MNGERMDVGMGYEHLAAIERLRRAREDRISALERLRWAREDRISALRMLVVATHMESVADEELSSIEGTSQHPLRNVPQGRGRLTRTTAQHRANQYDVLGPTPTRALLLLKPGQLAVLGQHLADAFGMLRIDTQAIIDDGGDVVLS